MEHNLGEDTIYSKLFEYMLPEREFQEQRRAPDYTYNDIEGEILRREQKYDKPKKDKTILYFSIAAVAGILIAQKI